MCVSVCPLFKQFKNISAIILRSIGYLATHHLRKERWHQENMSVNTFLNTLKIWPAKIYKEKVVQRQFFRCFLFYPHIVVAKLFVDLNRRRGFLKVLSRLLRSIAIFFWRGIFFLNIIYHFFDLFSPAQERFVWDDDDQLSPLFVTNVICAKVRNGYWPLENFQTKEGSIRDFFFSRVWLKSS